MVKSYVLDTSAIAAFTGQEEGAETVETLLKDARKKKCHLYVSFVTWTELYYNIWRNNGENRAKEAVALLNALPLERIHSTDRLMLLAGRVKALNRMSFADAYVAATALEKSAILVHKDPELENISPIIETLKLPFKPSRKT